MSVLNKTVSMFMSALDTKPVEVNLVDWLTNDYGSSLVNQIRVTSDKKQRDELKKKLPCITPSGLFSKRSKAGLTTHSGLVAFDIDNVGDSLEDVRALVVGIPNVAYCGLSVSGNGLWGLIPVSQPDKHEAHFRAIEVAFKTIGIAIDKACKDVSRLRFYSTDPLAHFNHHAVTFEHLYYDPKPVPTTSTITSKSSAIDRAVNIVLNARDGEKWICLTKASFLLGGYVGSGEVSESDARIALQNAIAQHEVSDMKAAHHTIDKGLRDGQNKPIHSA